MRGDETKFDNGKIMWDLLPYDAIEKIADILTYGHDKYTKDGWKSVPDAQDRYFAALMRHITAHRKGEKYDEESGRLHIAHAATNALFLLWFELQEPQPKSIYNGMVCFHCKMPLGEKPGDIYPVKDFMIYCSKECMDKEN